MGTSNGHLSEEKIQELKNKYGKHFAVVDMGEDLEVAIRAPKRSEWKMFTEGAFDGGKKTIEAAETLVRTCLVYPEDVNALMDEYPALYQTLVKPLGELAGNREEVRVKKY